MCIYIYIYICVCIYMNNYRCMWTHTWALTANQFLKMVFPAGEATHLHQWSERCCLWKGALLPIFIFTYRPPPRAHVRASLSAHANNEDVYVGIYVMMRMHMCVYWWFRWAIPACATPSTWKSMSNANLIRSCVERWSCAVSICFQEFWYMIHCFF